MGAEKFFDIKCRIGGLKPSCVVLVATVRALKYNGGVPKAELAKENTDALKDGIVNLGKHIENMQKYGLPVIVAINRFMTDTDEELKIIEQYCCDMGVDFSMCEVFAKGGDGGVELAEKVVEVSERGGEMNFAPIYDEKASIDEKINTIAKEIYGADGVVYTPKAKKAIARLEKQGFDKLPICMAKTQYSLSDDPSLLGRPSGFEITVREVRVSAGAEFVVALTGDVMTMPGLPKVPAANNMDIDKDGKIVGLF